MAPSPLVRLGFVVAVGLALAHPSVQSPFDDAPAAADVETAVEHHFDRREAFTDLEADYRAACMRMAVSDPVAFRCDLDILQVASVGGISIPLKVTVLKDARAGRPAPQRAVVGPSAEELYERAVDTAVFRYYGATDRTEYFGPRFRELAELRTELSRLRPPGDYAVLHRRFLTFLTDAARQGQALRKQIKRADQHTTPATSPRGRALETRLKRTVARTEREMDAHASAIHEVSGGDGERIRPATPRTTPG